MKYTWEPGPTGGLVAQTPFCSLSVFRQQGRRERYAGRIEGHRGRLASIDDLLSEAAAQRWCEGTYRELLEAELSTDLLGLLREVGDYLYNPFEPDNQSQVYRRVRAVIDRLAQ